MPGSEAFRRIARPWLRAGQFFCGLEWPLSVGVLVTVAGVVWYSLGRAMNVPTFFADELIHDQAARNLALHGALPTDGYGFVSPAIDSVAYLLTSNDVAAYRLVQAFNVTVMVTAAFFVYPLARRALSHQWALVVAALTLALPWFVYARFVLTEPAFYPVFMLFALTLVRALERPTLHRQLIMVVSLVFTYLARTQAVSLAGAVVVAIPLYGMAQGRLRAVLRAFAPTLGLFLAFAIFLGVALGSGLWSPLGPYRPLINDWHHPHGLAIWAAANLSSLFLGLGVLVGVASPLGVAMMLRRTASTGAAALAAVSVSTTAALLTSVSLLSESLFGQGSVHERDFFYAAPLIITCAIAWATNRRPRPRLLSVLTAGGVIGLAASIPAGTINPNEIDALSFKLWAQINWGPLSPADWIVAATAAGALVVLTMRSAWPVVLAIALSAICVASVSNYRTAETQAEANRYAWVDRAVPANSHVTILFIGNPATGCRLAAASSPLPTMSLLTEFFNSRVDQVGYLVHDNPKPGLPSEKFRLRHDGIVASHGRPLRPAYVVTDARIAVAGTRTATLPAAAVTPEPGPGTAALTLWRINGPLRLLRPAQVLHPGRRACNQ